MSRKRKRQKSSHSHVQPGSAPGTLSDRNSPATMNVLAYSPTRTHAIKDAGISDLDDVEKEFNVVWIDIIGTEDINLLLQLADRYQLHLLSLEDVTNPNQRGKFESYDKYNYCVLRMFTGRCQSEQLSVFHMERVVITLHAETSDCLQPLRNRIQGSVGHICERSTDYLLYSIIDSVLDHYFPVVAEYDDILTRMDDRLVNREGALSLREVHQLGRELMDLRKWLRPHREVVSQIMRSENHIHPETMVYLRDCHDHVTQLSEGIDYCFDLCGSLHDFYFNAIGTKTNEIMKTLTFISTIFIPLSFLAGLYGMNFRDMPGLDWQHGFWALSIAMIVIVGLMIAWFRRRGWFT